MAGKTMAQKRAAVTNYVVKILSILDKTGDNPKMYKDKLTAMSDKQFTEFMKGLRDDPKANLYFAIVEYDREPTIEDVEETAKAMDLPLFEHVAIPDATGDPNNVTVTPEPVPVGYIHQKRMPQTLMKKSAGSTKIEKRSPLTGQVTSDDKNARNSDLETYSMVALGGENALKEFMGPRADNMLAKNEMYKDIGKNGYCSLEDLTMNDPYYKSALNTFDMFFLMQGLKTNAVTDLNHIPDANHKPKN